MERINYNNIINEYFQKLCSEKQYSFAQSKELYQKILNTNDEEEKIKLREDLICGTLGLLKKYIEKSLLGVLDNNVVSLEDILSDCIEIYINLIDNGELLEARTFSTLFNHILLYKFGDKYDKTISNNDIYKQYLLDILNWYNKEIEIQKKVNYTTFYNKWKNKLNDGYIIYRMYILVKDTYDILYRNNIKINSYDLQVLKKVLVYINFEKYLLEGNYLEESNSSIKEVEDKIIEKEIRECLTILTDKQEIILKEYYGFDSVERTYEEIAENYKVTRGCINNILKNSYKKILKFRGKELKKLRLVYDGSKNN